MSELGRASSPWIQASLTLPRTSPGPRRLGNRLHNPRSRESGANLGGLPGPPRKGFGAEHVRAAVGPSHCDTAAPAQSPPPGRHMLPAPTAGGRPARQPLGPAPGGPPPPAARGENDSDSCPSPSLLHSRGRHARISAWLSPPSHTCWEGARAAPTPGHLTRGPEPPTPAEGEVKLGGEGRQTTPSGAARCPARRAGDVTWARGGAGLLPSPRAAPGPATVAGEAGSGRAWTWPLPPARGRPPRPPKRPPPANLPSPEGCGNPAPAPQPGAGPSQAATAPRPDCGREPRAPTLGWCEDPQILGLRRVAAWRTKPPAASRSLRKNVQLPSPWD